MRERIRCEARQANGYQCGLRANVWVRRPSPEDWVWASARCPNHGRHWTHVWPIVTGDPVADLLRVQS